MSISSKFRLIMLDEMMVTSRTFPTHEWSALKNNMMIDKSKTPTNAIAVLAAVSRERGLDLVMQFDFSVKKGEFKVFLEELRRKYFAEDIVLVMDNLMVHKCREVCDRMDELGFRYSWTPPYSPSYNGIEEVFSIAKR